MKKSALSILQQIRRSVGSVFLVLLGIIFLTGLLPSSLQKVYAEENCLYLDEENGDDTSDGKEEGSAVQSFAKAKELAREDQSIRTIYVLSTVHISGDITLDGTRAILKRAPSFTDYLLTIDNGSDAVLHDITVDGGGQEGQEAEKSLILLEGNLTIEDGTVLQNNHVTAPEDSTRAYGGAINVFNAFVETEKTLTMTGGIIQNNSAYLGGGICLWDSSTFTMSGGIIRSNKATGKKIGSDRDAAGGGIAAFRDACINLSGDALITKNFSSEVGGGISLGTITSVIKGNTLNMTGGTISENKSGSAGSGIYVQAGPGEGYSVATISGGKIINNEMLGNGVYPAMFGGGGIYVNGTNEELTSLHNGMLYLKNAVIKKNRARLGGAGYASCPSSSTEINVKNGVAIFGNVASRGSDILIESGYYGPAHNGSPSYQISPFMLGGTPYRWKENNRNEIPLNKLSGKLNEYESEILQLHTDVKEDEAAENLSEVEISGNRSATNGGGIGSNGTVIIGEREVVEVDAAKVWKEDTAEERPESILLELYRASSSSPDDPVLLGSEKMTADSDGNWKLRFKNLPKSDANDEPYLYSVKEVTPEGYSSTISGNQEEGFTLINTKKPDVPTPSDIPTPSNIPTPSDIPTPKPDPKPTPGTNPSPNPGPNPVPEPSPRPVPIVAGESKPIPVPVPITNTPIPEVKGTNRKPSRIIPQTEDKKTVRLWFVLFILSGFSSLLLGIVEKKKDYREKKKLG